MEKSALLNAISPSSVSCLLNQPIFAYQKYSIANEEACGLLGKGVPTSTILIQPFPP